MYAHKFSTFDVHIVNYRQKFICLTQVNKFSKFTYIIFNELLHISESA